MRILQVVHGFPPKNRAGTEIYTYYLSKELAKKHDVHIFYPTYGNVKKINLNTFEQEDLTIHEIKLPNKKTGKLWNLLFFNSSTYLNKNIEKFFEKFLKEIRPDVIHFEHLINLSASLISIAKRFCVPTILTLHDYWFMCLNIQLLQYDYTICDWNRCRCHECWINMQIKNFSRAFERHVPHYLTEKMLKVVLNILNPPEKFEKRNKYLRTLLLDVDKIIAPSRFLREMFIRYCVPRDKIIYSENGYNLNAFKGFRKKKDTDKLIFGYIGGIARHKGVHILINAFMNVPEDRAELRIYGAYNPNSGYVREILQKAKQKSNIKFVGKFEDVKDPYSEIDVLVFPSIWYENCPLVLAEARATKTPVIASNLGAIPEFVEDKKTGLLFEPGNSDDLYNKIMKIIENPKLIRIFKENISLPKSIEEQAKEIEEVYKSLIYGGMCDEK